MRLISVALQGYRRFEFKSVMDVDNKVVAILGPNEVGKTAFLKALMHLDQSDVPFVRGSTPELTRNATIPGEQAIISARYMLDSEDYAAVASVTGSRSLRTYRVWKLQSGEIFHGLDPELHRDMNLRSGVTAALNRAASSPALRTVTSPGHETLTDDLRHLAGILLRAEEDLVDETIETIRSILDALTHATSPSFPKYIRELPVQLQRLIGDAQVEHPNLRALGIISQRQPKFMLFGEDDRTLAQEHALVARREQEPHASYLPPLSRALINLGRLAGLNFQHLHKAILDGDEPTKADLLSSANRSLATIFDDWPQGEHLSVDLTVNHDILHVLVSEAVGPDDPRTHSSISERSDGLRWFVALRAFLTTTPTQIPPILLIDEAEAHLHYDAQADMVRIFSKQKLVKQVLYTTHSAGCLPEDLGTGVRLISPISGRLHRSEIINWFWNASTPGFSPILIGMGAGTLAFMPLRDAIIAEGPSDHLLLPSMLREVTGRDFLGFQIVPGLSNVSRAGVMQLSQAGANALYLVDNDSGGRDLQAMLVEAGIDPDNILMLPAIMGGDTELEDYIQPDVLAAAAREVARKRGHSVDALDATDLPSHSRYDFISTWFAARNLQPPSKPALAYRVLDARHDSKIVDTARVADLLTLFESIRTRFVVGRSE